jgi:hypothetical protein
MKNRREFIRRLSALSGILATTPATPATPAWANEQDVPAQPQPLHHPGKVKSVIFYYCHGGPAQGHTFDPPQKAMDPELQPFRFQKSGQSGIEISELFPRLQTVADELCLIRSGYGAKATHNEGGQYIFTGASQLGASLGSWMLHGLGNGNPNLPGYTLLTGRAPGDTWARSDGRVHGGARSIGAGGLPPSLQAQVIGDLEHPMENLVSPDSTAAQERWLADLASMNAGFTQRHERVNELTSRHNAFEAAYRMQTAAPEAFDATSEIENPRIRELYGLDPLPTRSTGTKLLLARRLAERGVRFILVPSMTVPSLEGGSSDWDTHTPTTMRGGTPNLAMACDQPLTGLITDLKDRGLLDQTLVIWGGEMGRGGNGFMNHNGSAFTWWMAGGGVRGGSAYGATDELGFTSVQNPVHVRDLHATILWMCGLDYRQLQYNGVGLDESCKIAHGLMA